MSVLGAVNRSTMFCVIVSKRHLSVLANSVHVNRSTMFGVFVSESRTSEEEAVESL